MQPQMPWDNVSIKALEPDHDEMGMSSDIDVVNNEKFCHSCISIFNIPYFYEAY